MKAYMCDQCGEYTAGNPKIKIRNTFHESNESSLRYKNDFCSMICFDNWKQGVKSIKGGQSIEKYPF
ncbi:MAG: hypothetical protein CMI54_02435 [Parcubacteria group bacterium]|jgi:hypothetical protein|nr:hypothetical protein [Parcubacteria group bacterium]|tara:strand:+ start:16484 stop:16684 length:201 start_codon:yes stop_codon:yes gene_type:complete